MMEPRGKGTLLILLSAFSFAWMSVFVRLAGDLPFFEKALFRNGVALAAAGGVLLASKKRPRVPRRGRGPLASRVICGMIAVFCNFYAIDRLILASANSLNKLAPFFAVVFAALFLKERVDGMQIACILTAFAGSLFLIVPTMETLGFPCVVAILGALASGGAFVSLRALQRVEAVDASVIVWYFSLSTTAAALIPTCLFWEPMTLRQLACLLLAGTACAFGQYALTNAYRYAPPREISIYDCTQIVFSGILGYVFFRQVPDIYSVIAYVLIVLASAVPLLHGRRARARRCCGLKGK